MLPHEVETNTEATLDKTAIVNDVWQLIEEENIAGICRSQEGANNHIALLKRTWQKKSSKIVIQRAAGEAVHGKKQQAKETKE